MSESLKIRILNYARAHWDQPHWKARFYALGFGAGLKKLNSIKPGWLGRVQDVKG